MNKRTALTLARKLTALDRQSDRLLSRDKPDWARIDAIEAKQIELVKAAVKKGLKLVYVQVADGGCLYYEAKRTTRLATFEWLYGDGDIYVSDWGKTVSIPLKTADRLIKNFRPEYI